MKTALSTVLLFFVSLVLCGQQYTVYDIGGNLPFSSVTGITQTANGQIWLSTEKGVIKFEGNTWKRIYLPYDTMSI
ncbi:MAG: hypothetical protein V4616_11250, partial [Bacteroidota bacterium]